MKGDAVIRVPREAWERMRSFALTAGRDIREATATAMDEYIKRQEQKK